jgi:hypothetical protein
LENYLIFHLLGLLFIVEGHLDEAKATTSHGNFVSHYNLVLHLANL